MDTQILNQTLLDLLGEAHKLNANMTRLALHNGKSDELLALIVISTHPATAKAIDGYINQINALHEAGKPDQDDEPEHEEFSVPVPGDPDYPDWAIADPR